MGQAGTRRRVPVLWKEGCCPADAAGLLEGGREAALSLQGGAHVGHPLLFLLLKGEPPTHPDPPLGADAGKGGVSPFGWVGTLGGCRLSHGTTPG